MNMQRYCRQSGHWRPTAYLLTALILLLGWTAESEARVYLDFTSPNFKKVPMAVPYFRDKSHPNLLSDTGRKQADLLSRGLEFHGFIDILPAASYGGLQERDWQAVGADFVILGTYEGDGKDLRLEMRLLDVREGRMILGRRYKGPAAKEKEMLLTFCDEAIKHLTGTRGISQSHIAFTSDASGYQEAYVADILGDNIKQVTRHKSLVVSPKFSPDGKQLAYTSYHKGNPNLYVTNLAQDLLTRAISRRRGLNLGPSWSPNGKIMALTFSMDGNPDLFLMSTSGQIIRRLTYRAGINVSPSWSPDGRKLAFVSDRSGDPQIYVMDMKSSHTTRITFRGNDNSEPTWSPDGKWLAYTSLTDGSYHICVIKPDGSSPIQLTRYAGDHESPSWSPDGNQLVFSRHLDNKQSLYVIFKNGSGLRKLFDIKGNQKYPQWSGADASILLTASSKKP
jgi:TolB protein